MRLVWALVGAAALPAALRTPRGPRPPAPARCECALFPGARAALARSHVVFAGTVERVRVVPERLRDTAYAVYRYPREALLRVDSAWKLDSGAMATLTAGAPPGRLAVYSGGELTCAYVDFQPGRSYFVYAARWYGPADDLRTHECAGTGSLHQARRQIGELGEPTMRAAVPAPPRQQPAPPRRRRWWQF